MTLDDEIFANSFLTNQSPMVLYFVAVVWNPSMHSWESLKFSMYYSTFQHLF